VNALPGVGGTLFPSRFLANVAADRGGMRSHVARPPVRGRTLSAWWTAVERECGPATGSRAAFDQVAMPLFGMLGYQAGAPRFDRHRAEARLRTPGGASVGLLLLPWAARPSTAWSEAVAAARRAGGRWCFVLAPPYLSLVDARGHASRRAAEFTLPDALDPASVGTLLAVASARAFDGRPPTPLEALVEAGARFHDRVRLDLQDGVVRTLDELPPMLGRMGTGAQEVSPFDEALTVVYRILFLLFAESRHLVPASHPIYRRAYAIHTLCRSALAGDSVGLWDALAAITRLSRAGCRTDDLIVRPFNGRLFARAAAPSVERRRPGGGRPGLPSARSESLRRTLVALGTQPGPGGREAIDYADLGVEQLGAVYERVLDLDPGRRKQTGTFYTPQPLAELVVRRTLAPLVAGRTSDGILSLRVVDPAMGSGAFLVAACRFLADAFERALVEEGRRAPHDVDEGERAGIRRLVAERCLAGVDLNPVAVQVARLSLWLATLARGKPLGFLDHQLRAGNSLIGAAPDDLHRVPGRRSRPVDRALPLLDDQSLATTLRSIAGSWRALRDRPDDTVGDVRTKEVIWRRLTGASSPLEAWRLAASLWCAQWFWADDGENSGPGGRRPSTPELRAALDAVLRGDRTLPDHRVREWLARARALAARYRFFHWPLEFPDVFYDATGAPRDAPGFDAVVGNPPWEMLRREAGPDVAGVASPARMLRFVRDSGLYAACDRGHLNLYQPFVDRAMTLTRSGGRMGLVLPWSFAADEGARALRRRLFDEHAVDTVVGLDNAAGLFPIHRGVRFLVVTASRGGPACVTRGRFGVKTAAELDALPGRESADADSPAAFPIRLSRTRLSTAGGSARRVPDARSASALDALVRLCRDHPRLGAHDGWNVRFGRELNATDDRGRFGAAGLPVIDGKHLAPFVVDPSASTRRIVRREAERRLPDRRFDRPRLAYRDVSGVGNRRCLIAAIVPAGVVTTHTLFCLRTPLPAVRQELLCALFNSDVLDAVVRMLMGTHVTASLVADLPVPAWRDSDAERRLAALARRLARSPDDAPAMTQLQAGVARLYGVAAGELAPPRDRR